MALDHVLERRHRQDDPGVDLVGAHDDGAVDLSQGVTRRQVIEPQEGPDFRAVADHPGARHLQRPHVVGDHNQVLNARFSQITQSFERFGLARPCIPDKKDRFVPAARLC